MAVAKREWSLEGSNQPYESVPGSQPYELSKRVLDLLLGFVALVISLPISIAVAVALKLDSHGPVLFRQQRVGRDGELFWIWKFRTMEWPPQPELHQKHVETLAMGPHDSLLRMSHDPRVTRVGRVLRDSGIDELPNLWNVLRGEMSMVGPRPLVPYEIAALDQAGLRRLQVMPGLTGLAQINGRQDVPMNLRTDYDLIYLDRRGFLSDLSILIKTPAAMLTRKSR